MNKKRVTIFVVVEDGERRELGHEIFHGENKHDQIQAYLMENYWDARLDAASCSPDFEFEEVAA